MQYDRTQSKFQNTHTRTEPDRLMQYDRTASCVIAQQYFSATFVSLCFYCRKESFNAYLKNDIFLNFVTFKIV
jgi:hypothetical protein